jgi:DNA gyrase subunit A
VMLMTDAGRLIRVPADQVRLTGRSAMGVMLFRVNAEEHVTSVFPVIEDPAAEDPSDGEGPGQPVIGPDENGDPAGDPETGIDE